MKPKIIQILFTPNSDGWQGMLLGLADDGAVYGMGANGEWEPLIPPIGTHRLWPEPPTGGAA